MRLEVFEVTDGIGHIGSARLKQLDRNNVETVLVAELLHADDFVKTIERIRVIPDLENRLSLKQRSTFEIGVEVVFHRAISMAPIYRKSILLVNKIAANEDDNTIFSDNTNNAGSHEADVRQFLDLISFFWTVTV